MIFLSFWGITAKLFIILRINSQIERFGDSHCNCTRRNYFLSFWGLWGITIVIPQSDNDLAVIPQSDNDLAVIPQSDNDLAVNPQIVNNLAVSPQNDKKWLFLVQLQWESTNLSILAVNPQNDKKVTASGTKKIKSPNLPIWLLILRMT